MAKPSNHCRQLADYDHQAARAAVREAFENEATCIGCTDSHACVGLFGPCSWVRLDREARLGVCSACTDLAESWDTGDRRRRFPVAEKEASDVG